MALYRVQASKSFQKDFGKLKDSKLKRRIKQELLRLRQNPFLGEKLETEAIGKYRIRIGDYRVRYDIFNNLIILYRVRHRREIYRK